MGGEGSMAYAIKSLKMNRALLKKRKIKDLKQVLRETSGKTELEFKAISAAELKAVKSKIRAQHKKELRRDFFVGCFALLLTCVILYFIYTSLF
ncbi:MAG: hypothetical protein WBM83_15730 [Flavobacteriaceae bacterium]